MQTSTDINTHQFTLKRQSCRQQKGEDDSPSSASACNADALVATQDLLDNEGTQTLRSALHREPAPGQAPENLPR